MFTDEGNIIARNIRILVLYFNYNDFIKICIFV